MNLIASLKVPSDVSSKPKANALVQINKGHELGFSSHYQNSLPRQNQNLQVSRVDQGNHKAVEKKQGQTSQAGSASTNGKSLPLSGETLPPWLKNNFSDEDLQKLQLLLSDQDASWYEQLSGEQQRQMEDLAQYLGLSWRQLIDKLQQAMADLNLNAQQLRSPGLKELAGLDAKATAALHDLFTAMQKKAEAKEIQFNQLVSRLGQGDLAVLGQQKNLGESVQQLMQSANQGLGSSLTAQSIAPGLSASTPTLLSQAIAQTNAEALASRISMMQGRGLQIAEMRLDPPELGKLRIQIRMQGDQATVVMQSPNAQARDLLENALPRLRELLEQQGIALADASVSEEAFSGDDKENSSGEQGLAQGSGGAETGESTEEVAMTYFDEPLGLIDYYA